MKKIHIVKENREFNRLIQKMPPVKYKNFIAYIEKGNNSVYQFGFSVGKKIGNAVVRNKIKRQLKSILDENDYQNNFKCIIIVKKGILNQSFQEMREDLKQLVEKLEITKGINQ